ncbi:hypothetical protein ERJ75_000173700 [Trypanosoma vivax]|nr:hypothetical protein ERJ75_000173700 [Trypanosoma vivax]
MDRDSKVSHVLVGPDKHHNRNLNRREAANARTSCEDERRRTVETVANARWNANCSSVLAPEKAEKCAEAPGTDTGQNARAGPEWGAARKDFTAKAGTIQHGMCRHTLRTLGQQDTKQRDMTPVRKGPECCRREAEVKPCRFPGISSGTELWKLERQKPEETKTAAKKEDVFQEKET